MLRTLCTMPALRLRLPFALPFALATADVPATGRRAARPMAVPIRQVAMPMAVPMDQSAPSRASQFVAAAALAMALAGLWRQENVVAITRIALDGLRSHQALALDLDAADVPAMDPYLARVLDPRVRTTALSAPRGHQVAVQPFSYEACVSVGSA